MQPPIALLTDFGESDPFVGVMKGVILSRAPKASIIDLTHRIPPQDVRLAAFSLMGSFAYFPRGTIFVCVVDPGVGSGRRILWARTKTHQFLAPDNGLLSWVGIKEPFREVRAVENRRLFLKNVSATFHGRDVFAPVAAALARGAPSGSLGSKAGSWQSLDFPRPRRSGDKALGCVLAIDRFGNAVTNLTPGDVGNDAAFRFRGRGLGGLKPHYSAVKAGEPLAIVGSFGFIELSVREGSFASSCGARAGDPVEAA